MSSWNELQDALFAGSWNPELHRYRSHYAFRGIGNADFRLNSSLSRLGGDYAALEPNLLRNFRKYAPRAAPERDSVWYWLSVGQHHGLPTRLLDWTFSPLVALHFMTAEIELYGKDGLVWAVDFVAAHELLPSELRTSLESEGADVFTAEMLSAAIPDLKAFGCEQNAPFAIFFEPPSLDERIVNQWALHSAISDPNASMGDWLDAHPDIYRSIVVPAELKWEVRDKLDQANITERVLFPGLDGLSRWLARQYRHRD
ncbi:MAG TPA: FRG domain-containing protein [Trueperaceae bacterium]